MKHALIMDTLPPGLPAEGSAATVYTRPSREESVKERIRRAHSGVKLVAIDYFPEPFTPLQYTDADPADYLHTTARRDQVPGPAGKNQFVFS